MGKEPKVIEKREEDPEVAAGFPEDGDEHPGDGAPDPKEADKGQQQQQQKPKETVEERLNRLEVENARLTGELRGLSTTRSAPQQKPEPKPERDWEKLFFEDTPGAIKALREDIKEEITTELTTKYSTDRNTRDFWAEFYRAHPDLKDDDDLVQATLNKNAASLGDLPVAVASSKLADLTRERIMRYTGEKKEPGKKAVVEGGGPPKAPSKQKEPDEIVSLGDVIRARRANRQKARTA